MVASTLTYPLDLIRTKLSMSVEEVSEGMWQCGKNIYTKHGFLGLYKGWFATMVGITPYIGINMCTFDWLK